MGGDGKIRFSTRENRGIPPPYLGQHYYMENLRGHRASTPQPRPPGTLEGSLETTEEMSTIRVTENATLPGVTKMENLQQELAELRVSNAIRDQKLEQLMTSMTELTRAVLGRDRPDLGEQARASSHATVNQPPPTANSTPSETQTGPRPGVNSTPPTIQTRPRPGVNTTTSANPTGAHQVPRYPQPMAFYPPMYWPWQFQQPMMAPQTTNAAPCPTRRLLELPDLSGQPEQWPKFYAAFNESTRVYQYTDLENLTRLQKSLSGEAKDVVDGLLIHPENVRKVMDLLKFRFGRPDLLVRSQVNKLRQVRPIAEGDFRGFINLATKVKNMVSLFITATVENHLANPTLLEDLVSKLPDSKKLEWAKYMNELETYATLRDFDDWIEGVAKLMSLVEAPSSYGPPKSNKNQARVLVVTTQEDETKDQEVNDGRQGRSTNCLSCESTEHNISSCARFKGMSYDDKWKLVRGNRICFSCLERGHQLKGCPRFQKCAVDDCPLYHHPLLHKPQSVVSLGLGAGEGDVSLRFISVKLIGPKASIMTFALLDEGSCATLMEASLAKELGLEGKKDDLHLQWYDNRVTREKATVVSCQIQNVQNGDLMQLRNVKAVSRLNLSQQTLPIADLFKQYPVLKDIPIQGYVNAKPRLLIGLNNARLASSKRTIHCGEEGPIVSETPLGWVLYGPLGSTGENTINQPVLLLRGCKIARPQARMDQIEKDVAQYLKLESLGIAQDSKKVESKEDKRARHILETTTQLVENRYQTGLLWKQDDVELPDNFHSTLQRLKILQKKLKRDPEAFRRYEDALMQYETKGYARQLDSVEANQRSPRTWYLPHFGVENPEKQKLRIVFDCAAKTGGQSLNTHLLTGPDLNQPLLKVLYQFRERPVAVCADIKEMFPQVMIRPDDRPAQRFLWQKQDEDSVRVYEMKSMLFGAASSPCAALFVMQKNARRFATQFPDAVEAITTNHYMDDYVKSFDDEAKAIQVSKDVRSIHWLGGFQLRGYVSNSQKVRESLTEEIIDQPVNFNLDQDDQQEKILGMRWDTSTDEFFFKFNFERVPADVREGRRPPTKRELLSLVMSVFDPFGLLANITILAKVILQATWSLDLGWDDPLPDILNTKVRAWLACMMDLTAFRVPRCHSPYLSRDVELELHIMTDASEAAMAVAAYWRVHTPSGIVVSLICGKNRCAPRKPLTVPRLELQAAVLGARMKVSILKEHTVQPARVFMWTDSKTVLLWIKSDPRQYHPFVMHRITEIRECTEEGFWRLLPTKFNSSDDGTRPPKDPKADSNARWVRGDKFLLQDSSTWPGCPVDLREHEVHEERRKTYPIMLSSPVQKHPFKVERFSNYSRLIRAAAYAQRAVAWWKKDRGPNRVLTASEVIEGERMVCMYVQRIAFAQEYQDLSNGETVDKTSSIWNVDPYLDTDGLIRCGSRIQAAEWLPYDTRNPIIMPRDNYVTHLLIAYYHRLSQHQFFESVLCRIRERFWVPRLRSQAMEVIKACQHCKVAKARPVQPMMGQLPSVRLEPFLPPFAYTGLDYFGPVTITVGRHHESRWVALFTCTRTRAVHLEIAHDYSTDALILCIRNFINLRGKPRMFLSDQGTNFIGYKGEVTNVPDFFDMAKVQEQLAPPAFNIEWRFNTPKDPSAGGIWERLVQSIKKTLKTILHERYPKEHVLKSLLYEAMNIVNSRPLTDVPMHPEDGTPLTPNHFLMGFSNSTQTPNPPDEGKRCSRRQWRHSQLLKDHFWARWLGEYLPTLTRRSKWHEKAPPLAVGQLVLICDPKESRNSWKRGRISSVVISKDGQVRSAVVTTSTGDYHRPAHKLAVLDVCDTCSHGGGDVAEANRPVRDPCSSNATETTTTTCDGDGDIGGAALVRDQTLRAADQKL